MTTTTARENILAYVFTLLQSVPNVDAYRTRETAVDRSEGTVLILQPVDEPVTLRSSVTKLRALTFKVIVITRGAVPDQIADPAILALTNLLQRDQSLGLRCALIQEVATTFNFETADGTAMEAEIKFLVKYQTSVSDFSAQV
jgi:hypothetical protein